MNRYILDRLLLALTIFAGMVALIAAAYGYGGSLQPALLVWRTPELPGERTAYEAFYHQAGWLTFAACLLVMLALVALRQRIAGSVGTLQRRRFED